jgi:hypothetical protein
MPPEIPNPNPKPQTNFIQQIPKHLVPSVPLNIEIWRFLGVWVLGFGASAKGGFSVENDEPR